MSIEFLRAKTQVTKTRLDKLKPRLRNLETFSLDQHITDMMELLNEIDILNETLTQMTDQYQWEMYSEIRAERTADEIQKYREQAIRELEASRRT